MIILDITEVSSGTAGPIANAGDYVRVADYGDLSHMLEFLPFYGHVNANCGFNDGDATSGALTCSGSAVDTHVNGNPSCG